ncbi:MAG: TerB family tellurite resistance protein [Halioglobus sp.]
MINALKALFEIVPTDTPEDQEKQLLLAACALLVETARADFTQDAQEEEALAQLLISTLEVEPSEVRKLIKQASARVDESISLYEFTRTINDHYGAEQKLSLVKAMWVVAYADGNLDKYEEHLIRQVAELTYVSHEDYIRVKLQARDSAA